MNLRSKDMTIIAVATVIVLASGILGEFGIFALLGGMINLALGLLPLVIIVGAIYGISRFVSRKRTQSKQHVHINLLQK